MDELRKSYRVVVIVGLAMMASLVMYLVLVGLFEGKTIPLGEEPALSGQAAETVKFALVVVTVAIYFAIRLLNRKILGAVSDTAGGSRPAAPGPADRPALAGRLVIAAVVTFALCEAPGAFGLVLYILTRNTADFYLFLLISLFLFATNFPKFSQWEEWHRRQTGGRPLQP